VLNNLKRLAAVSVLSLVVLGLSGCGTVLQEEPQRDSTPAEQAWSTELDVVGQPVVVDGVAVVYAAGVENTLSIVGLDPDDGSIQWRRPAGQALADEDRRNVVPQTVTGPDGEKNIVYLRPGTKSRVVTAEAAGWYGQLVVLEPESGSEMFSSSRLFALDMPHACGDDDSAICLNAEVSETDGPGPYRLPWHEHEPVADPAWNGLPGDVRAVLTGGLAAQGSGEEELAGVFRDGRFLWQQPIHELAGGEPGDDYAVTYDADLDRYLLELEPQAGRPGVAPGPVSLARNRLTSVEAGTGTVHWTAAASSCNGVFDGADIETGDGRRLQILCKASGTVEAGPGAEPSVTGLDVTIEGVDKETGTTEWSIHVGAAVDLVAGTPAAVAGESPVRPIRLADGPRLIDLRTGRLSEPDSTTESGPGTGAAYICGTRTRFEFTPSISSARPGATTRDGGWLASACDARANPVEAAPSVSAVQEAAVRHWDLALLGFEGRIAAYRLPAEQ
jgi:hypothetical protein